MLGKFTVVSLGKTILTTRDIKEAVKCLSGLETPHAFMRYYSPSECSFTWNKTEVLISFGYLNR